MDDYRYTVYSDSENPTGDPLAYAQETAKAEALAMKAKGINYRVYQYSMGCPVWMEIELPPYPALEANKHLVIVGVGPKFIRERLVYAPLASVGIDRVPDGLTGLGILWKHMPVGSRAEMGSYGCLVKRNLVLTGAAVPDQQGALHPTLYSGPRLHLVGPRTPIMGEPNP